MSNICISWTGVGCECVNVWQIVIIIDCNLAGLMDNLIVWRQGSLCKLSTVMVCAN